MIMYYQITNWVPPIMYGRVINLLDVLNDVPFGKQSVLARLKSWRLPSTLPCGTEPILIFLQIKITEKKTTLIVGCGLFCSSCMDLFLIINP